MSSHHAHDASFRHEALLYGGEDAFLAGTLPLIRGGLEAEEPVLIAVTQRNTGLLREALDGQAHDVCFLDMEALGRNPSRIIPAWRDFVAEHGGEGRPVRGIGEPIWAGRSQAELVECQRHEWLLNLAFADAPAWWLLCPYDTRALDDEVLRMAELTHPYIAHEGDSRASGDYRDPRASSDPFDAPLPPPRGEPERLDFGIDEVVRVRALVRRRAAEAGMPAGRRDDLVLSISELASNSVRHAGGRGTVAVWREDGALVCEVRDDGHIEDRLAGRTRPTGTQPHGRGLWLTNQLCDLVQIRTRPEGTVVRVHMTVPSGERASRDRSSTAGAPTGR